MYLKIVADYMKIDFNAVTFQLFYLLRVLESSQTPPHRPRKLRHSPGSSSQSSFRSILGKLQSVQTFFS